MPQVPELRTTPSGKPIVPKGGPPPPFTTWCDWAQDGLRSAMAGMASASGGVSDYHVGSRGLRYVEPGKQIGSVGWWNEFVRHFCGEEVLPASLAGRDTAFRVVPRDV